MDDATPQSPQKDDRSGRESLTARTRIPPEDSKVKRIHHLHNCLPKNHWLRQKALSRYFGAEISPEEYARIQVLLEKRHMDYQWRERVILCWILGVARLSPDQRELARKWLCPIVADLEGSSKSRSEEIQSVIAVFVHALCLFIPFFWLFYFAPDERNRKEVRVNAARTLARLGLPETVGALAQAKRNCRDEVGEATEAALLQLLPLLTVQHYGQLEIHVIPDLCALLDYDAGYLNALPNSSALSLKVLAALEQIGDGRAVKTVERIITSRIRPQVTSVAETVLPVLYERRQREQESGMLLRGASAPETLSEMLLRPTTATSPTPAEQLLRPAGSTDGPS